MSAPFIKITSDYGWIGRLAWWNSGTAGCAKHFGDYSPFPVTILGAWAVYRVGPVG
jgi:hypothetical protein